MDDDGPAKDPFPSSRARAVGPHCAGFLRHVARRNLGALGTELTGDLLRDLAALAVSDCGNAY